jgi:sulfate adenylyltransferase subunit 1
VPASTMLEPAELSPFLEREKTKDLLRFATAGSVDDGKSTLIGRLLYDSRSVYEDQLESVTKASVGRNAGAIDFSLLTDGLRAEREQGITIDVAYRYFATNKRKFIIADTPGHEQYTRNMVTGASTAELAIVLVDARKGLLPQSRRHAYISALLGLSNLVIAVNKMDLVDYDQKTFDHIETDFRRFLARFQDVQSYFVPISALVGDNVVTRSEKMPWFEGPSLLDYLETVKTGREVTHSPFRFAVQRVVRPNLDFRGYAGTIVSGSIQPGDAVTILPSGREAHVSRIVTFDGDLEEGQAGHAVTLALDREIDIIRGDMIAKSDNLPETATDIEATLVWLNETPGELNKRYRLKHTSSLQTADLKGINYRVNVNTLDREQTDTLEMNSISVVRLETARPLAFDPYQKNRATGSFILIDIATNATVAAGMISGRASQPEHRARQTIRTESKPVTFGERIARQGHIGAVISLKGETETALRLERALFSRGCTVFTFESQSPEVSDALMRVGAIVILTGGPAEPISIRTAPAIVDLAAEGALPASPKEAARWLETVLERKQILLPVTAWSESGGI